MRRGVDGNVMRCSEVGIAPPNRIARITRITNDLPRNVLSPNISVLGNGGNPIIFILVTELVPSTPMDVR